MALSDNCASKEWQDGVASRVTARVSKASQSIQASVCHALVLLGMGIEGMSCGGDVTPPGKH